MMVAAWWAVRRELRRSWLEVALVGLLVGAIGAFALTTATGARRAHSSWGRLVGSVTFPDLVFQPSGFSKTQALLSAVAADRDVAAVTAISWMPLQARHGDIEAPLDTLTPFAALTKDFGSSVYRPRIVHGRRADQAHVDEVMASPELATVLRARVGDTIDVAGLTADGSDTTFTQPATLVGLVRGPIELGPNGRTPMLWVTSAFFDRWAATAFAAFDPADVEGLLLPFTMARLVPGADRSTATARILAAAPAGTLAPSIGDLGDPVHDVLELIVWALAALAGAAALTVAVVGAQAVARLGRGTSAPLETLAALGMSPARVRLVAAAPGVAATLLGCIFAVGAAYLASALVPTGLAGVVEPHPGPVADAVVLVLGLAALVVALLGAVVWSTRRAGRRMDGSGPNLMRLRIPGLGSPTRAVGLRAGLGVLADPVARRRARSTLLTASISLLGLGVITVLLASGHQLLHSPARYGYGFDRVIHLSDDTPEQLAQSARLRAAADRSPDLSAVATVEVGQAVTAAGPVEVQAITPQRGQAGWRLVSGRPPSAPDEVVAGTLAARTARVDVGDSVALGSQQTGQPTDSYRVVGIAVASALGSGEFGNVIWVNGDATERLGLTGQPTDLLITVAPGKDTGEVLRSLGIDPAQGSPSRPINVGNLREVGPTPWVFAVVVALLLVASLAGALVTSVRAQRREMAVLRSMGFQPRQVRSSIGWQASTAIAVGVAVGLPAGVAIGAVIWRRVATRIGVDASVDLAFVWLALLALCAFAVANMVAVWPASRASHVRPADELRTE